MKAPELADEDAKKFHLAKPKYMDMLYADFKEPVEMLSFISYLTANMIIAFSIMTKGNMIDSLNIQKIISDGMVDSIKDYYSRQGAE